MTGSLQVSKGIYYIAMLNVIDNGKKKQKCVSLGMKVGEVSRKKAEKKFNEILRDYEIREMSEQNATVEEKRTDDILLADYILEWMEYKRAFVCETTYQSYENIVNKHLFPYFKSKKLFLKEVSLHNIQQYFLDKLNGTKKEKGLTSSSLKRHKAVLSQVLDYARKNDLLVKNPCEFVDLPKYDKKEICFYSYSQVMDLLGMLKDDPLEQLVYVTVYYGLRKSEVLGLQWDSVDFENDTLTIKHTVTKMNTPIYKDSTKTKASRRTYPLIPEIKQILLDLKSKESYYQNLFGNDYIKNDYIFKWPNGKLFSSDYVYHHLANFIKKHRLPYLTIHGLRHSCASVLVNQGMTPKDIQEWLGHSDVRTTMNIYGHIDMSRKKIVGETLSEMISLSRA